MTLAFDFKSDTATKILDTTTVHASKNGVFFYVFKRSVDIILSGILACLTIVAVLVLMILNPFFNPGKLFFTQERMGLDCKPFKVYKFRTMTAGDGMARSADSALEVDRITPLGRWLRKLRVDELPQILNVLKGDMSLIGPRPDAYHHAEHYVKSIPGYAERHCIRPGISGYAQTEVGYVEGTDATRMKVAADHYYIQNQGFRLEIWVIWRSLVVILGRAGS